MDNAIYVPSSPTTPDPSLRVDLGVVEITDSEPEDLGNYDLIWIGQSQEAVQGDASFHQQNGRVKEGSPMDIDAPDAQLGPPPPLDPLPDAPPIHDHPEVYPQEADPDPYSKHLSLVLEVVPDVLPQHALGLIEMHYPTHKDQVVQWVLQSLFDDPSYPKVEMATAEQRKGKRKASEMEDGTEEPPPKLKIDFSNVDRPKPTGKNYRKLALVSLPLLRMLMFPEMLIDTRAVQNQLYNDFPYIPVAHVRHVYGSKNGLYTPAHIQLATDLQSDKLPFKLKAAKTSTPAGKGKQKELRDDDFEKERTQLLLDDVWIAHEFPHESLQEEAPGDVENSVMNLNDPLQDEECGCCFSPTPFVGFPH